MGTTIIVSYNKDLSTDGAAPQAWKCVLYMRLPSERLTEEWRLTAAPSETHFCLGPT